MVAKIAVKSCRFNLLMSGKTSLNLFKILFFMIFFVLARILHFICQEEFLGE